MAEVARRKTSPDSPGRATTRAEVTKALDATRKPTTGGAEDAPEEPDTIGEALQRAVEALDKLRPRAAQVFARVDTLFKKRNDAA